MKKISFYDYLPLLEILNEAIVIYDFDRILWANEEYAKLRGYDSASEIVGLGTYSTVHPDEVEAAKKASMDRAQKGEKTRGTWTMRNKDGSYRRLVSHATPLPSLDNTITIAIVRPVEEGRE